MRSQYDWFNAPEPAPAASKSVGADGGCIRSASNGRRYHSSPATITTHAMPITSTTQIPISVFATADIAGTFAAGEVVMRLERGLRERGRMTLGCPGGRSLRTTYAALARIFAHRATDLRSLHIIMMDEYVEARGEAWVTCPADAHYSCRRFGEVEIRAVLNMRIPPQGQIPPANLHVPDPNSPQDYERLIEQLGGIDVFLLASGQSDGHVAFNPRGCALHERTRVIALAHDTRRDNLGTFPHFRNLDEVPRHGVSVGPGTIAHHSRSAILMLLGAGKGIALRRIAAAAQYDPDWPASVVLACADAQIITDDDAVAAM